MARGKKYSDEIKEKAYFMYAVSNNINEVSRKLGVPYATVAGWLKAKEESETDKFDKLREEKKIGFIEKSSDIIDKGLELLDRRFERALKCEFELDMLIDSIFTSEKTEISQKEKETLIKKLKALEFQDVRAVTTAVGTLYDKRALAKGESTGNTKITFELPKGIEEYAK